MVLDPPISRGEIEVVVEAAMWAPNHHMTEPWRFVVITGDARRQLGDAMSAALSATETSPDRLEGERSKPLGASWIIALISAPRLAPNVVPQEELVAAGAALQNMLLAAQSLGLASMVRTGRHLYSEEIRKFFALAKDEMMIGLVYLGRPAENQPPGRRSGTAGKVVWW